LRFKEIYRIVIFYFLFPLNGNMAYDIGRIADFRGPWCYEHANKDQKQLCRELVMLREMLQGWMNEAEQVNSHQ
tara:strand:+ start:426 stop:647 length:222 start_codon:yes stop_codon:yes gene_type:complete